MSSVSADCDLIEELRLRRWARENYVPRGQRKAAWHPVVHEEMARKDREMSDAEPAPAFVWSRR
jgi:hypothetical protein